MQDFPSNSYKARGRAEEPTPSERAEKIERVTTVEASRRKRGLGRQFKETFVNGSAQMAFDYMIADVVVPAIRDTIFDALQGGLDRLIYGDNRPRRGVRSSAYSNSNLGQFNYQAMSSSTQSRSPTPPRMLSQRSRARHSFDEIVIPNRAEAEEVIDQMFEALSRYGVVTVGELYLMTGIQSSHVDNKWGWTQLRGAKVSTRLRNGGYLLELPEPEPLN